MQWLTELVPVLSFVAGALLTLLAETLRDRRATAREERAFARSRGREDEQSARDFERETLLELQDAVQRYARLVGKTYHAAHVHIRRDGGTPANFTSPDDVDEQLLAASVAVQRLVARVADQEVAGWISRMMKDADEATMIGIGGRDLAHAEEHMQAFADEVQEVNAAIGARLRVLIYGRAIR
jgi:hypothetical protein